MVLHGQSAGGASVDYYSYAWTADPIISGFIPQSGSAAIRMPAPTAAGSNATITAESQWSSLSEKLACGAVSASEVGKTLSCMRAKPLKDVMEATAPVKGAQAMGSWGPKIDNKILFADLVERGDAGKFIRAVSLSSHLTTKMNMVTRLINEAHLRRKHQ